MGWYLRKSLKFGPLRINLSKSGLGTSLGVTGLRVRTGPKGSYLHAGREGLYYRKSLRSAPPEPVEPEGVTEEQAGSKDGLARWIKGFLGGR